MKYCILMGSPRKSGNTASILAPFICESEKSGIICQCIDLYAKEIKPCIACRKCQETFDSFGCPITNDMQEIFDTIRSSETIVLATPIYSWYCTPPMKAALDRLVYGMNKFYGKEKGPSIWEGKNCVIITTCGYAPAKGADLFEEGIKRYCKHSSLNYIGMLAERDHGYNKAFIDEEKILRSTAFAQEVFRQQHQVCKMKND